jgi:hypothetical protein
METTTKVSVKDIVKGTTAKFEYASCQCLWYKIITEDKTYLFPVDLSDLDDVGTTRFEFEYKSISLMRYVNKSIKSGNLVVYPTF